MADTSMKASVSDVAESPDHSTITPEIVEKSLMASDSEPATSSSEAQLTTQTTTTRNEDTADNDDKHVDASDEAQSADENEEEHPDSDKESLHTTKSQEKSSSAVRDDYGELKRRLSELESRIAKQKTLEDFQAEWENAYEQYGSDEEMDIWQRRRNGLERRLDETRKSHEFSTRLFEGIREDLDSKLEDEEIFERKLMTLRHRWEHGHKVRGYRDGLQDLRRRTNYDDRKSLAEDYEYRRRRLEREFDMLRDQFRFMDRELEDEFRWKERRMQNRYGRIDSPRRQYDRRSRSSTSTESSVPRDTDSKVEGEAENEEVKALHSYQIYAKSGETQMSWLDFKRSINTHEIDSTAIDVLVEEPYIETTIKLWGRVHRYKTQGDKVPKRRTLAPGQGPLPERIRINSTPLIKILEKIHGSELSTDGARAITILRPFKALIYYEDRLREWYNNLEKRYHARTDIGTEGSAKRDEGSKEQDTASQETGSHNSSHIDVLSIHEGEEDSKNENNEDKENGDDESASEMTGSTTALEHLCTLLGFIEEKLHTKARYLRSPNCKSITFSDIWYLFKPGDFVMEREGQYGPRGRQVYRVISVSSTRHKGSVDPLPLWFRSPRDRNDNKEENEDSIRINCVCVDFDGEFIGPVPHEVEIVRFEGEKPIKSLALHPLNLPEDQDLWKKLKDRGRKFLDVARVKHMYYDGYTLDKSDELDGQVMIDFEEAFSVTEQSDWRPKVETFALPEEPENSEKCDSHCCAGQNVHDDAYVEQRRNEEFMASLFPAINSGLQPSIAVAPRSLTEMAGDSVTDEELIIMSYRAFGFGLSSRTWEKLHLDYLDTVYEDGEVGSKLNNKQAASRERRTAFDELVLPQGSKHKHIVKSLIAQHFSDKEKEQKSGESDQPDMVRGKGKGLILLLHGAPGVGKTTTAEGVAEFFHRPLFQITCGDLGTTAKDVEDALVKHFALASKWGCILLLDEADVFLAQRDRLDYKRNGLVAVFLRILEYYAGVLFLTTNRLGDFDEAFASRIHISLHYPDLSYASTMKVFQLNLDRTKRRRGDNVDIYFDEIFEFVTDYWTDHPDAHWNGRQIRNACQTALALAEFEALNNQHGSIENSNATAVLRRSHFETVAEAYVDFIKYIEDIHGVDAAQRAWEQHLRVGRISGRGKKGQVNPLLRPKESGASSRMSTMHHRHAESYQNQQNLFPPGGVPNYQQHSMRRNQRQPNHATRPIEGYGIGSDMQDSYHPPQAQLPKTFVDAAPRDPYLQVPGGQQSGIPARGSTVVNPQYGNGPASDPGAMSMPGAAGYGIGGVPMISEGDIASHSQQEGLADLPRGEVQMNPMNQQ